MLQAPSNEIFSTLPQGRNSPYTRDNSAGALNAAAFTMNTDKRQVDAVTKKVTHMGDFIYKYILLTYRL
ncbi:hypothetical protein A0H81_08973 [Grifola frondosa]|uniref:Uncharacterized protein n=1 Tax=Grifola frondosa TaxID=5627 RepID=A0A1C7M4B3_GRIFR|nr:hypothetical protein A0H81_08973 [Grifola frondosa]